MLLHEYFDRTYRVDEFVLKSLTSLVNTRPGIYIRYPLIFVLVSSFLSEKTDIMQTDMDTDSKMMDIPDTDTDTNNQKIWNG